MDGEFRARLMYLATACSDQRRPVVDDAEAIEAYVPEGTCVSRLSEGVLVHRSGMLHPPARLAMEAPMAANPAKESLRTEQREQHRAERREGKDAELTHALENTFPASDPIASQAATTNGSALRLAVGRGASTGAGRRKIMR
ncbi:hypothetical protein [Bosea sp. (in: a-proteobacteria)]|uniref:hypothetical protein n=1 Tax=Bosea sp. (in: a-proteobacteria) TaxID=1871050 RepID=UPI003F719282